MEKFEAMRDRCLTLKLTCKRIHKMQRRSRCYHSSLVRFSVRYAEGTMKPVQKWPAYAIRPSPWPASESPKACAGWCTSAVQR
jgi:hypothetical protein